MATAISQEKFILTFLKGMQNTLEASNQQLFTKLQFLREVVNNQNNSQSGYLQGRAESINAAKKMIQVHFSLALKFKQRTDGFVLQNFEKVRSQELGLVTQVSDQFKNQILTFWNVTGGSVTNTIY